MKLIFIIAHFETYNSWHGRPMGTLYWHRTRRGLRERLEFKKL